MDNKQFDRKEDRRKKPTPFISRYTFVGKRRANTREEEQVNYYVDRLGAKVWGVVLVVVVLSVIDSIFTLYFLSKGYQEANPVMFKALVIGKPFFIVSKYILTILGIVIIGLHKNFIFVKSIMILIIAMYVVLNCHHLWLFFR